MGWTSPKQTYHILKDGKFLRYLCIHIIDGMLIFSTATFALCNVFEMCSDNLLCFWQILSKLAQIKLQLSWLSFTIKHKVVVQDYKSST